MVKMLKKNGYRHCFVKKACMRAPRVRSELSQEPLANISIPYVKGVSQSIRQLLSGLGIRVGFRPLPSLQQILMKVKYSMQPDEKSNVVYRIRLWGECVRM